MKLLHCVTLCLFSFTPYSVGWSGHSSFDPAAQRSLTEHDSLWDFVLRHINSQNTDYGCKIDEVREFATDQILKSIDSWMLLISLSLLVFSYLIIVHQHREGTRREMIAAGFLAQYHNAWQDAHEQAEEAICRYQALINAVNFRTELPSRAQQPVSEIAGSRRVDSTEGQSVHAHASPPRALTTAAIQNGKTDSGEVLTAQVTPNTEHKVDLVAQIGTLQQQLKVAHEREKNLRRELSKAHTRSQAEPLKPKTTS